MKVHQLKVLLLAIPLLAVPACKETPVEPAFSVDGTIVNRVTGEGISNMKLELHVAGFPNFGIPGGVVGTAISSQDGSFEISSERSADELILVDYRRTYQTPMIVNGEIDYFGIPVRSFFGEVYPTTFDIELYPKPIFFIDLVKKPGSVVDSVIVRLKNVDLGISQQDTKTIDIPGDTSRYGIHGACYFENILEIEYYVAGNGSGRLYNKTVECEPGKTTTVDIEYGL